MKTGIDMEQNSLKVFRIFGILFLIILVMAIVVFFIPKAGNLKSINFSEALQKANATNKPILITSYSKWDRKNKMNNQILFTNDSLLNILNSNFVTVILDADNESENKILKEYNVKSTASLVVDKNGKPITYIANTNTSDEFIVSLKEINKIPMLKWDSFDDAMLKSKQDSKPVICFVTSYINDNLRLSMDLRMDTILQSINNNYHPVLLFINHRPDFDIAQQLLGFDDKVIIKMKENFLDGAKSNNFNVYESGLIKLVILNSDKKVIAQNSYGIDFNYDKSIDVLIDEAYKKEESLEQK